MADSPPLSEAMWSVLQVSGSKSIGSSFFLFCLFALSSPGPVPRDVAGLRRMRGAKGGRPFFMDELVFGSLRDKIRGWRAARFSDALRARARRCPYQRGYARRAPLSSSCAGACYRDLRMLCHPAPLRSRNCFPRRPRVGPGLFPAPGPATVAIGPVLPRAPCAMPPFRSLILEKGP